MQQQDSSAVDARRTESDAPASAPAVAESRPIDWWAALPVGAAAAVLGLLPWIVTGMRLPLQNLWAADTAPDQMPVAFLPMS